MNATTTNTIVEPIKTTIRVKKQRGPYKPRKPKALVVQDESDSDPEPEPVSQPTPEPTGFTLTEEDLVEGAKLIAEQEAEDSDDDESKSSLSSIADDEEESDEEPEETEDPRCICRGCGERFDEPISEGCVCDTCKYKTDDEEDEEEEESEEESQKDEDEEPEEPEEPELLMPVLEKDPVLLREQILNLQAEVIRLTKFNQDLQRRLEGERKQPKKKAEKAEKAKKEGKRKNKRDKRPSNYADLYLKRGQVLRWEHKARKAWAEATFIGKNSFTAKFSFKPEGEYAEEFPSLNAVANVMLKHLTLRSLNAWSAFKTPDGKSVENLDLVVQQKA